MPRSYSMWCEDTRLQPSLLPLASCVTLGKLLSLSVPYFPPLRNEVYSEAVESVYLPPLPWRGLSMMTCVWYWLTDIFIHTYISRSPESFFFFLLFFCSVGMVNSRNEHFFFQMLNFPDTPEIKLFCAWLKTVGQWHLSCVWKGKWEILGRWEWWRGSQAEETACAKTRRSEAVDSWGGTLVGWTWGACRGPCRGSWTLWEQKPFGSELGAWLVWLK